MRVAVVHTENSPCQCHEAIAGALSRGGHEPVILDAEELLRRGEEAVKGIRVAFDHTDTIGGTGRRRNEPRRLLERAGIAVAGSTAEACELADDKLSTKERLIECGVPVPRGRAYTEEDDAAIPGLRWPRVLKSPHEHMSRGVVLVKDEREQHEQAKRLIDSFGPQLLVEEYVEGREIAVTVATTQGTRFAIAPRGSPLEWPLQGFVLSLEDKLDPSVLPVPASLSEEQHFSVWGSADRAFRGLGLRDYARVDLRLAADGLAYVLEVNPRPSLEVDGPTAIALRELEEDGESLDGFILQILECAAARADGR